MFNFNLSKTSSTNPEPSEIKMQCQSSVSLLSNEITSFDCSGWWPPRYLAHTPNTRSQPSHREIPQFFSTCPQRRRMCSTNSIHFPTHPLCQSSSRVCSRSRHDLSNNKTSEYRPTVSLGYSSSRNRIQSVLSTWLLPACGCPNEFH